MSITVRFLRNLLWGGTWFFIGVGFQEIRMTALYFSLACWLVFVLGVAVLGMMLRNNPTKANAEKFSRIVHFLFFAVLSPPFLVMFITPGYTHLDELVGIPSLPFRPFFLVLGILLMIPGLYFLGLSNKSLRALGSGANAFRLTKRIVDKDVYQSTRNPMSLGYYLVYLSLGFLFGSTFLTLIVLLGLIPAHLFALKFFEERELELRFGESYKEYKRHVPFLFPRLRSV